MRNFNVRLFVAALLIGQREVAGVAGVVQPPGELRRRLANLRDGTKAIEHLLARLRGVERCLHLGDQLQDFVRHPGLGPRQLCGGDSFAQRQHDELEKILRDRVPDIASRRRLVGKTKAGRETRVAKQARLDHRRLGDSDLLEARL